MSNKSKSKLPKDESESKGKKTSKTSTSTSTSISKSKSKIVKISNDTSSDNDLNDEDTENESYISGWSISKEDQTKYKKEYKSSLKNLSYESKIDIGPIKESELWVDIYAPKSLKEYIDEDHNIEKAKIWITNFRNKVKKTPAILLLTGKPGIGKTTLAHLLLKEFNYDYHEFNASEARSGKEIKDFLEPFNKGNILSFFEGCSDIKKGLIMDEVDGIDSRSSSSDGLTTFLNMTEANKPDKFKYPIICIANDSGCNKIDKIRKFSLELEIKPPSKKGLKSFITKIGKGENLDIDKDVIDDLINNSDPDFRQIANKLSYLTKLIKNESGNGKKKITMKTFDVIKGLTQNDKRLELTEMIDTIMLPSTNIEESIRLYETDINIISMSFYSNFTENITKLNISNKDKIRSISEISQYLVDGEIYADYYWKNKVSSLEIYQGVNQILSPKYLMNKLCLKDQEKNKEKNKENGKEKRDKTYHKWDFTGKRIFYLNPHIMDRFWKIGIANQIYSTSHLSYLIELIWNLLKSKKYQKQDKIYRKILHKLFEGGLEIKDFENIYKGFTLGTEDNKLNEEYSKELKGVMKPYFTDYQTNCLMEFQANLELSSSQLASLLSLSS